MLVLALVALVGAVSRVVVHVVLVELLSQVVQLLWRGRHCVTDIMVVVIYNCCFETIEVVDLFFLGFGMLFVVRSVSTEKSWDWEGRGFDFYVLLNDDTMRVPLFD
jgi:hypothetical protein